MENKRKTILTRIGLLILVIVFIGIGSYNGYQRGYFNAKNSLLFNPEKDICDITVANNELLDFVPSVKQLRCKEIFVSSVNEGLFCVNLTTSQPVRCIQWHKKDSDAFHSGFNTQQYYRRGGSFFSSQP